MTPPPPSSGEHDCAWKEYAKHLQTQLDEMKGELEVLRKRVYGRKSERLPPVSEELRKSGLKSDLAAAQEKRRARAAKKAELPAREIHHPIPEEKRVCPSCGGHALKPLGAGRTSIVYEYVVPRLEKQVHVQEVLACACGEGILTAEAPAKVVEKGEYGPGLIAHLVTAKCADSLPLYRLEKAFGRQGLPLARSTMVELFHRAAEVLAPLAARLAAQVVQAEVVHADETPLRVQAEGETRKAYLWTFLSGIEEPLIVYRYSPSRSGKTPVAMLGGTTGALVVDAYTGYNQVTTPEGRTRVGCMAHVRRKFFEALPNAPEAQQALDFIRELYRVEAQAREANIVRTPAHRALRDEKSRPILAAFRGWLEANLPVHLPKSRMGIAIRYALGQWEELNRFVSDERLPLDNNRSEAALRVVALGRKNFLFVGHDQAGENLAGLYSLVSTCQANGINPERYLADVLLRVQTHPNSRIDELLPAAWAKLYGSDSS